ncbi:TIGR03943 family putative permease subunit [Desulfotomaculum sp. 1211_IL3151]|uniref:TIGR03943 family putative permease subunit n=1 Tax=Desulfotomaculum sp. 1211_IL3151 TaxID=3084055 RepID=UPI002FDB3184
MRARAFNPQIFLEFLCYCSFGALMLYLASSGKYLSYVTPRMKPYLCFTAIVMLIWACVSLFRLFRPQHKVRSSHCFVLAIPVLLLLLPHSPLSTSDLSGNYLGGNTFSGQVSQYGAPKKQAPPDNAGSEGATSTPTEDPLLEDTVPTDPLDTTIPGKQSDLPDGDHLSRLPGLDAVNKKITVSNDDFGLWLSEIYTSMDKYEGYTVVMTGFVFKDPETLKENEFVPARLMMSCCVADLAPAGLLCKYDKASELKKDSWVMVEGTIFIGQYDYDGRKYNDPQIRVTKITPAEAVEGYVYLY